MRRTELVRQLLEAFGADHPEAQLVLLHRGDTRERRGRIWLLPVQDFLLPLDPTRALGTGDLDLPS